MTHYCHKNITFYASSIDTGIVLAYIVYDTGDTGIKIRDTSDTGINTGDTGAKTMKKCTVCGKRDRAKGQSQCLECKREINAKRRSPSQHVVPLTIDLESLREEVKTLIKEVQSINDILGTLLETSTDEAVFKREVKKIIVDSQWD